MKNITIVCKSNYYKLYLNYLVPFSYASLINKQSLVLYLNNAFIIGTKVYQLTKLMTCTLACTHTYMYNMCSS